MYNMRTFFIQCSTAHFFSHEKEKKNQARVLSAIPYSKKTLAAEKEKQQK